MTKEKFTFFWKGPLSQWQKSTFIIDGIKYCCAEQYMMAEKARLFKDNVTLTKIMQTTRPRDHQTLGRQVVGFNLDTWNSVARDIVYKGNIAKFSQNEDLKQLLIATGDSTLVEASPYDVIWGIGMSEDNPDIHDRTKWKGTNWLGEVLTKVKRKLLED